MVKWLEQLRGRPRRREPAWIEPGELEQRLGAGDEVLVLDVRGAEEFAGPLGHIDASINLPLADLPKMLPELAADGRSLVCVCLTDRRSSQAAAMLMAAGHRDVAVLRGGMRGWRDAGRSAAP